MNEDAHHHHHHHQYTKDLSKAFLFSIVLNFLFVIIEAAYGFYANSLSLIADAGHNLGDVAGLVIAWLAFRLAQWKPTTKRTYGFSKATVLAALSNAIFLFIAVGAITREAIGRIINPVPPDAGLMVWVAFAGIVVNTATALMFLKGSKFDLNVRGAFLHMIADAAVSVGVVIAGLLISATGILIIDPLTSILVSIVILIGTWRLFKDSLNLALDAVPEDIDYNAVVEYLSGLPGVTDVRHVHIWGLSTTSVALTAHLVISCANAKPELLSSIKEELRDHYGISHATLQFETPDFGKCRERLCKLNQ